MNALLIMVVAFVGYIAMYLTVAIILLIAIWVSIEGLIRFFKIDLVINVFAKEGVDACVPMLKYMGTMVLALLIHYSLVTYGGILRMADLNRIVFLKNGTVIMQSVATVFIAQAYGVEFGIGTFLTIMAFMFGATIGTAGIPSGHGNHSHGAGFCRTAP